MSAFFYQKMNYCVILTSVEECLLTCSELNIWKGTYLWKNASLNIYFKYAAYRCICMNVCQYVHICIFSILTVDISVLVFGQGHNWNNQVWILVDKSWIFPLLFLYVCWLLPCRKGIFNLTALIGSVAFYGAVVNKSGTADLHPTFLGLMIESSIYYGIFCLQ